VLVFRVGVGVRIPRIRALEDPSLHSSDWSGHEIRTNMAGRIDQTHDGLQRKDRREHKACLNNQLGCVATMPGRSLVACVPCTTVHDVGPTLFAQRVAPRNLCVEEDDCPPVVPRLRLGKGSIPLTDLCDAVERSINDVAPACLTADLVVDLPPLVWLVVSCIVTPAGRSLSDALLKCVETTLYRTLRTLQLAAGPFAGVQ
jgi:hypothetical protein